MKRTAMKSKGLRMTKFRAAAKGKDCQFRIPGHHKPAPENENVVFCHAPCEDKGMGIKSPDWWGGYGCDGCHTYLDGHPPDADEHWQRAIYATLRDRVKEGLVDVSEGLKPA